MAKNVLGTELKSCCTDPVTGFFRNGRCDNGPGDTGLHIVCAVMTAAFLRFSQVQGNDLSTPAPQIEFPGLSPGDRWCLCVDRWKEAFRAGVAPPIDLEATHISALEFVTLDVMQSHAVGAE